MGFIFESDIVSIMNTVRARTIGEADAIQLKDILVAEIHPAIKAYFKAEVEKLLHQARSNEVRSKRFPYGLPEVSGLQRQIDLLLVNFYQFDQQEFEALVDEAVHLEFNFLCRPQWTLLEFMFENKRTVAVSEAIRKFRYCVEYTYFAELFKRYVVDRGLAELSYEEFKSFIAKVDREVVERHSTRELARLLRPMLEFIEVGIPETPISETGPVLPINAAIVFFEDKRMDDIKSALEHERDSGGKQHVSLTDLEGVIARLRKEDGGESRLEKPKVPAPMVIKAPATRISELPQAAPQVAPPLPAVIGSSAGPTQKPMAPRKDVSASPASPKNVYDLFTLKEQKAFVRKLFNKDEVEFRNALDRLDHVKNWKEASLVLDEIFTAQNADPFSPEAIQLTEKLFSRYDGNDQKGG